MLNWMNMIVLILFQDCWCNTYTRNAVAFFVALLPDAGLGFIGFNMFQPTELNLSQTWTSLTFSIKGVWSSLVAVRCHKHVLKAGRYYHVASSLPIKSSPTDTTFRIDSDRRSYVIRDAKWCSISCPARTLVGRFRWFHFASTCMFNSCQWMSNDNLQIPTL